MQYLSTISSPLGQILLACDDIGLTGLWFEGSKYYGRGLTDCRENDLHPYIIKAKQWLEIYFAGRKPDFQPPLHLNGSVFESDVWEEIRKVPYGETTTYGNIAGILADKKGMVRVSARAVGGAVGRNKISIIIPCHRVLGSGKKLVGYAGGLEKKSELLKLEGHQVSDFRMPGGGKIYDTVFE